MSDGWWWGGLLSAGWWVGGLMNDGWWVSGWFYECMGWRMEGLVSSDTIPPLHSPSTTLKTQRIPVE